MSLLILQLVAIQL